MIGWPYYYRLETLIFPNAIYIDGYLFSYSNIQRVVLKYELLSDNYYYGNNYIKYVEFTDEEIWFDGDFAERNHLDDLEAIYISKSCKNLYLSNYSNTIHTIYVESSETYVDWDDLNYHNVIYLDQME